MLLSHIYLYTPCIMFVTKYKYKFIYMLHIHTMHYRKL